jgi:hypothetical protein
MPGWAMTGGGNFLKTAKARRHYWHTNGVFVAIEQTLIIATSRKQNSNESFSADSRAFKKIMGRRRHPCNPNEPVWWRTNAQLRQEELFNGQSNMPIQNW